MSFQDRVTYLIARGVVLLLWTGTITGILGYLLEVPVTPSAALNVAAASLLMAWTGEELTRLTFGPPLPPQE